MSRLTKSAFFGSKVKLPFVVYSDGAECSHPIRSVRFAPSWLPLRKLLRTIASLLALVSLPLLLSNCASAPQEMSKVENPEGRVKAKVLVRDLKRKKSQVLDMQVAALEPGRLRMDFDAVG